MIVFAAVIPVLALAASPSSSPVDSLPQNPAGAAVRRAIDHSGGWKTWEAKKTAELKITSKRARADGSGMDTRSEIHRYRLGPAFGVRIEADDHGKKVVMVNNGRFAAKVVDAKEDLSVAAAREAREDTFAAHYLFGVPFKLTDKGARLESLGQGPLEDGTVAERIRVTYEPGAGDTGGQHTWTYFFDSRTGALRAARVDMSPDKTFYFEFFDEKTVDGLRLPTRFRESTMNASGKRGTVVGEWTTDEIRFDAPEPDEMFLIPPR